MYIHSLWPLPARWPRSAICARSSGAAKAASRSTRRWRDGWPPPSTASSIAAARASRMRSGCGRRAAACPGGWRRRSAAAMRPCASSPPGISRSSASLPGRAGSIRCRRATAPRPGATITTTMPGRSVIAARPPSFSGAPSSRARRCRSASASCATSWRRAGPCPGSPPLSPRRRSMRQRIAAPRRRSAWSSWRAGANLAPARPSGLPPGDPTAMPAGTYRALLRTPGYRPLVAAQALGTFNSNIYRIVVGLFAARLAGDGGAFYLALGAALFALLYLLFSGYAGLLADRVNKRTVLIAIKVLEIAGMALACLALWSGGIAAMLGVLFLLGLLAACFAPAKYGILPDLLGDRDLSRGNGLADMSTVVAILLGTTLGAALSGWWPDRPFPIGLLLVAVAVLGALASLFIAPVPDPRERPPIDLLAWAGVAHGWRRPRGDRPPLPAGGGRRHLL